MAQPEIPGTGIGKPVMPYGSNAAKWIALLVDALGRLQVDANIDNLPSDLATQTTLNALLTELKLKADLTETQPVSLASLPTGAATIADGSDVTLGALADAVVAAGAAGSLSAKLRRLTTDLDALLTELKLKADLTETQPISAASLPLPSSAATETTLDAVKTAVEIIDGFALATNKIFGYNTRLASVHLNENAVVDTNILQTGVIDADELWVVTQIGFKVQSASVTTIELAVHDGSDYRRFFEEASPVTDIWANHNGMVMAGDGDRFAVIFYDLTAGDDIYANFLGYKMKV